MSQLVSDMNICTYRVKTARWLGASAVAVRELALASVARISGSVCAGGRAVDATVLGENKEWKEDEDQKRLGQHPVGYFSLNKPGSLGGRGGALVAVDGRNQLPQFR